MGTDRQKTTLLVIGSALLLMLLATGLHDITLQPGRPLNLSLPSLLFGSGGGGISGSTFIPGWLLAAFAIGFIASLIGLIVSARLRRDLLRMLPIYLLFGLGVYLISQAMRQREPLEVPAAPPPELAETPPLGDAPPIVAPDLITQPPEWLVTLVTVLLVAAILGGLFILLRRLMQRRPPDPLSRIVEEAREALADLSSGADLRDTISRCYAEMVKLLSEQRGMGRDPTLTPREFELRLATAGLADTHIRRLTRLFERVRYSPHPPGPAEEREAEACLRAIAEGYPPRAR
jgi:Domain of unknown function (DUF4129)